MQVVGLRSILPLLPTLVLACVASSPSAPEQAVDAAAPPSAVEQPPAATAPGEPSEPKPMDVAPERDEVSPEATSLPDSAAVRKAPSDAPPPSPAPPGVETERSQSRLDIAVPSINGGLNRDIIRRTASDHADDIRDCHGRALASLPDLDGKIVAELWVNERGQVTNAELTGDEALNSRIGECVVKMMMGWSFADAGGVGSFKLAFDFASE